MLASRPSSRGRAVGLCFGVALAACLLGNVTIAQADDPPGAKPTTGPANPPPVGAAEAGASCPAGAVCEEVALSAPDPYDDQEESPANGGATLIEPRATDAPAYEQHDVDDMFPAGPATLPYHDGEPVPPGYHVSDEPNEGLLIAGGTLLGLTYAPPFIVGAIAASSEDSDMGVYAVLAVPLIGPPLLSELVHANDAVRGINIALASGQGLGLLFLGLAFAATDTALVRDDLSAAAPATPRVSVVPLAAPSLAGLAVMGTL